MAEGLSLSLFTPDMWKPGHPRSGEMPSEDATASCCVVGQSALSTAPGLPVSAGEWLHPQQPSPVPPACKWLPSLRGWRPVDAC